MGRAVGMDEWTAQRVLQLCLFVHNEPLQIRKWWLQRRMRLVTLVGDYCKPPKEGIIEIIEIIEIN